MPSPKSGKLMIELLDAEAEALVGPEPGMRAGGPGGVPGVRVPLSTIYISCALVAGLVLLAWAVGYKVGNDAGRKAMAGEQAPDDLPLFASPALPNQPVSAPAIRTTPGDTKTDGPGGAATSPAMPGGEPIRVLTASGPASVDPRQPGFNYLELAVLPTEQAASAVRFLAAGGVEAIAVPAGTAGRMRLISIEVAIPSERYRQMGAERRTHERRVAALGKRWVRERQGGSDFSRTLWRKYEP